MSNIYDKQVAKMKHLIDFGSSTVNEDKAAKPIVECQVAAADGNTYGILREGTRYYIKSCPTKNSDILAEDYEYIGGELNKKSNEYTSYANASKFLGMKVKSINEAYKRQGTPQQPRSTAEWQAPETKEIREEINRFNEICNNIGYIMSEGNAFTMAHTLPEAPAKNPAKLKTNCPFVQDGVAEGDKDEVKTSKDHKDKAPFNKAVKPDSTSGKTSTGGDGDVFNNPAKYDPENNIASKKPKGGKAVKITEAQARAWGQSKDFPYGHVNEGCCDDDDCPNGCKCSDGKCVCTEEDEKSKAPKSKSKSKKSKPQSTAWWVNDGSAKGKKKGDDEDEDEFELDVDIDNVDKLFEPEEDDSPNTPSKKKRRAQNIEDFISRTGPHFEDDDDYDPYMGESRRRGRRVNEDANYFGQHPAYRKAPMTGSARKSAKMFGKEWDDASVASEKGYGQGIGDSFPYTKEDVEAITDNVMANISQKLKPVRGTMGYGAGVGESFPYTQKDIKAMSDAVMEDVVRTLKKKI